MFCNTGRRVGNVTGTEREMENNAFFNEMLASFNRNFNRAPQGFRYNENMKLFCAYIRLLSGKLGFETFKANTMYSVPSLRSTDRYIKKVKSNAIEGKVRADELYHYLSNQNLPLVVTLSEDATRINGRVQYDVTSNQIVGFSLPLNENGMPIPGSYPALTAAEIESYFYNTENEQEKQPANLLNVVMAQPLSKGIPAFCVLLFCTNGSYDAKDVKNRWKYIADELRKKKIKIAAIASDSEPRYNAAMKDLIQLGVRSPYFPVWFNASVSGDFNLIPIQDTIHIGTKFRNRMLSRPLKFGKHQINIDHLKQLLKAVSKEQHKLTEETIQAKDRMNFKTVLKICNSEVIGLLEKHIPKSEGTVLYLRVLDNILRSFLDTSLSLLERIKFLWFSLFILRIWKEHILNTKGSTLYQDFVTTNAYHCVEINAHGLIFFILFLKENNLDHLFLPDLLGSQQCEAIFRQIRSLSSTFSTVTNASMLEIIGKISKIELMNDITHYKLKNFNFPRVGKPSSSHYPVKDRNANPLQNHLPTLHQILETIESAKQDAVIYAASLGVKVQGDLICTSKIKLMKINKLSVPHLLGSGHRILIRDCDDMLTLFKDVNLREYAIKLSPEGYNNCGLYVRVQNGKGQVFFVTKHTLVWLLSKTTTKLSSDRLIRVMTRSKVTKHVNQ